jgi:hypothetical protein
MKPIKLPKASKSAIKQFTKEMKGYGVSEKPTPKKPSPLRWGDEGYKSPSARMKDKWRTAKVNQSVLDQYNKTKDVRDLVRPTGLNGTAYSEADMAKRNAIGRQEALKTAGKIALGGAAGYGAAQAGSAWSEHKKQQRGY